MNNYTAHPILKMKDLEKEFPDLTKEIESYISRHKLKLNGGDPKELWKYYDKLMIAK